MLDLYICNYFFLIWNYQLLELFRMIISLAIIKLLTILCVWQVGGYPAWLALKGLPSTSELSCRNCSLPMTFLCQLYFPDSQHDYAFHRYCKFQQYWKSLLIQIFYIEIYYSKHSFISFIFYYVIYCSWSFHSGIYFLQDFVYICLPWRWVQSSTLQWWSACV